MHIAGPDQRSHCLESPFSNPSINHPGVFGGHGYNSSKRLVIGVHVVVVVILGEGMDEFDRPLDVAGLFHHRREMMMLIVI